MSNCEPIAGLRETQAMPSISFGGNCLYFQGRWLYSYLPVSPEAWGDISHLTVVSQRKFYHRYWISAVSCFFLNTGLRGKAGLLSQRHYQRTWHVWWFSWEPRWDWNLISPLNINYLGIKASIISLSLSLSPWRCVCLVCLFAQVCASTPAGKHEDTQCRLWVSFFHSSSPFIMTELPTEHGAHRFS